MTRVLVLVLVLGCDWSLHRMQEPVACTVHGTNAYLPNGACDLRAPDGVVPTTAPVEMPPLSRALLERGRDRFERMCAPCHGLLADGDSYVARAMTLRKPPSLVDAAAARLADQRILDVIGSGYGLMPSYASAIAAPDRFAILHYVRALQGREVALDDLTEQQRREAMRWLP